MFIHGSDFLLTRETDFGKKLGLLAERQKLKLCVPHEELKPQALRYCGQLTLCHYYRERIGELILYKLRSYVCVNENCLDQQRSVCVNRLRKMLSFGLQFSFIRQLRLKLAM